MRGRAIMAAAALSLAAALAGTGRAAADDLPGLSDVVPGHPGGTYLDLLRQAIPGLAYNAADRNMEGHLKSLRHIMGKDAEGDPPDPVVVDLFEVQRIKAGGKPRLVLLANLGDDPDRAASMALLALYDDGPKPKLLDAVDVGVERSTSFNDKPSVIPLGPGDDALVIYGEHFNSNQTYAQRQLIFVRGDRLREIDDISLLSDRYCGYARDETPSFATTPGTPYRELVVTVTETLKHNDETCDEPLPVPYAHTYRTTYRWDAARGAFVGTGNMASLDKLNAKRF